MGKFSERNGFTTVKSHIQIDSMNDELRISLWNVFYKEILSWCYTDESESDWLELTNDIWTDFFKLPADELDADDLDHADIIERLKDLFFRGSWADIYDLVEFIAGKSNQFQERFIKECNTILERESSGYRILSGLVTPITNSDELTALKKAIDSTSAVPTLMGINTHLVEALKKLSARTNRDYRNSIKESISAIEGICCILAETSDDALGKALLILKEKLGLHAALVNSFRSVYGYTSDDDGIRHFLMDESTCDIEDAVYMLVTCSAFVNYLLAKAGKAGLSVHG
jgi:hypothetical protein